MARVLHRPGAVEAVHRLADRVGAHGHLAGNRWVDALGAVRVCRVDRRWADHELVVDRIVVAHHEPHERSGPHLQILEPEVAVMDVDGQGHQTGTDDPPAARTCNRRVEPVSAGHHRGADHHRADEGAEPAHAPRPTRSVRTAQRRSSQNARSAAAIPSRPRPHRGTRFVHPRRDDCVGCADAGIGQTGQGSRRDRDREVVVEVAGRDIERQVREPHRARHPAHPLVAPQVGEQRLGGRLAPLHAEAATTGEQLGLRVGEQEDVRLGSTGSGRRRVRGSAAGPTAGPSAS